ncbi:hypothetical protein ACH4E8_09415 [Streptomyces sp. NPDC017979]|uniref:YunG family protein n=1 Tax=Streptomyces sp. NPDC017979 TaxID=3365024 RepID=UPI0037A5DBC3
MTARPHSAIARALHASWAADICSPDDIARAPWTPDNPARGQCDITALVVHDLLGGHLLLGEVTLDGADHGYHWWNRLPDGTEIDLTREQFRQGQIITPGRAVQRPPGRLPRRHEEYEVLKGRVLAALGAVSSGD